MYLNTCPVKGSTDLSLKNPSLTLVEFEIGIKKHMRITIHVFLICYTVIYMLSYGHKMDKIQKEIHLRDEKIASMAIDIQDLKMIASVSENTKQEAIDNLTQRHQEELESLRKAMEGELLL